MFTIEKENTEYVVKHEFTLKYVPLSDVTNTEHFIKGDNLYLVQVIDEMTGNGDVKIDTTHKTQSIVTKEYLDKLSTNIKSVSVDRNIGNGGTLPTANNKENPVYLAKREFLDFYKKFGTTNASFNPAKGEEKHFWDDFVCTNFCEKVMEQDFQRDYVFIQFKESNSKFIYIETSDGEKLMPPIYLSYIEGTLDNKEYKLEELAEHLLNNFNIDFYKDDRRNDVVNSKKVNDDTDLSGIIKSIPYYNCDDGRNECIELHYYPTQEETKLILDDNAKPKDYWTRQSFVVNELLGGKNYLIDPPKNVSQPLKKNKFR